MKRTDSSGKIARNTLYTIGGALVLNGVLQLLIYPQLAARLGAEQNGTMLYLMALVNTLGPSVGQALNNSRLVLRRGRSVTNGDYSAAVFLYSLIGIAGALLFARSSLGGAAGALLTALLILLTDFRYYGDVEYRLSLNYRRYFLYYAVCSAGYAAGFCLYRVTGNWYLIFLAGEAAALLCVAATGCIFRNVTVRSASFRLVMERGGLLVLSYFVTNLTLNIDRLFLKPALGGEAVSVYYAASLIGKTLVLFIAPVNTIVISYLTKDRVRITKKRFMKFAGIGLAVSAVFFALCEAVTPVFIRLFYPSLAERTQPILTVVTLSQILAMLSAYLFIVVLTFTGEIWQLILQCCHLGLVLVLISVMTKRGGLTGFSAGVLLANLARVAVVLALGVVRAEKNPEAGDA